MSSEDRDTITALLNRAAQRGIGIGDLAGLLPVSEAHLRNIRNGHRRLTPELHTQILDALDALGVDTANLPTAGDQ